MDMIRASDDEVETMIHIAVVTAPEYALREVMTGKSARDQAVEIIVQRVFAKLRRYELMRQPKAEECAVGTLPLFGDSQQNISNVMHDGDVR